MNWENKTIVITGGAGFIGSHLVKRLVDHGSRVIVVDNLERGKLSSLSSVKDKVGFFNKDLKNPSGLKDIFKGADVVIHLASKVGGIGVYTSRPYEVFNDMVQIDKNVLDAVLECGIENYFYASSAHVYPIQLQQTISPAAIKEKEAYPADPELSYGMAKLIGEKNIQYAQKEGKNLKAGIARFIGIYGEGQDYHLDTGSVIPVFSHRAIRYPQVPFEVWGTGRETRSYCYVGDAVECILRMISKMEYDSLVGPLNVGKQEFVSIKEIAEKIIAISGKDITIKFDESKETLIWGQWCDCSAAKRILGWEAKTTFDDGLKIIYSDVKMRLENGISTHE